MGSSTAYIDTIREQHHRRALTEVRTGVHWGAEEHERLLGRTRRPQAERHGPHCEAAGLEGRVEDTHHIVFDCSLYADVRERYPQLFPPACPCLSRPACGPSWKARVRPRHDSRVSAGGGHGSGWGSPLSHPLGGTPFHFCFGGRLAVQRLSALGGAEGPVVTSSSRCHMVGKPTNLYMLTECYVPLRRVPLACLFVLLHPLFIPLVCVRRFPSSFSRRAPPRGTRHHSVMSTGVIAAAAAAARSRGSRCRPPDPCFSARSRGSRCRPPTAGTRGPATCTHRGGRGGSLLQAAEEPQGGGRQPAPVVCESDRGGSCLNRWRRC